MTRAAVVRWIPPLVYVLIPSFLVFPILFSEKMLYGHDVVSVFHYSRIVIAEAFREGRLPVWDPHVMAGFPLLAAVQGAVFYPPTWLCAFMSAGTFWTLSAWIHLVLSGLFAHRWLERGLGVGIWAALAGSFVFMLSGFLIGHLYAGHVNYVWAYPWIPALLWRLERFLAAPTLKRGALLAVVMAMLFLAGVPQFVFFAGLLVAGRLGHFILGEREGRKERLRLAGTSVPWIALGLLLCAPQLFPTLELIGQMQRGSSEDPAFTESHAMAPRDLAEIVFPPSAQDASYFWERCGFIGGGALLLLGLAFAGKHRQRFLWAAFALSGLILALGPSTPAYPGLVWILPGADLFRGPGRYLLLFTTGVAALAALGFESLWARERLRFRIPAGILALAAGVQLTFFAAGFINPMDPVNLSFPLQNEKVVQERCGIEGRVAPFKAYVSLIGRSQAAGLDMVGGYEPMMLRRYAELMNAARGAPIETNMVILSSVGPHPVIDMLAVRAWVSSGWTITDQENPLPRAWLVNNAVVIESKTERLQLLARGKWDPRKTVVLEEYPAEAPPVPTETSAGRAKVVSKRPGEYVLEAENGADAYLVLSEAYYPGWQAEVDGRPADLLPANHLIQAIRLSSAAMRKTFR
ncbi:MAG: hypothetical protein HY293_00870 [Planctomycetes bacterium]|nr:hypothetical protein [Planctomycetota bacterium]